MAVKKAKTVKEEPKVVEVTPVSVVKVEKAPERTVKCGNCGADHPFGTLVCDKCGYTRVYVQGR